MPSSVIEIPIDLSPEGYKTFIRCKGLPKYTIEGRTVFTDAESYHHIFGEGKVSAIKCITNPKLLFDYQQEIVNRALFHKRYAAFLDCGLGKTRIELSFADSIKEKVIYFCPLSVMGDIEDEAKRMNIGVSNLRRGPWTEKIGLMNFEGMKEIDMRGVKGGVLDESSILKNGEGSIREYLTDIFANLEYRLCASAYFL